MYNLLVTAERGVWGKGFYEYDKSRFLEFTNEDIASALKVLTPTHVENLKSYPCIFAYEGDLSEILIGNLTSIKERGRTVLIEFELRRDIQPIPFERIKPIAPLLDIRGWEMNRTHWAVKDEDLFTRLENHGIPLQRIKKVASKKQERPTAQTPKNPKVTSVQGFIGKFLTQAQLKALKFFIAVTRTRKNTNYNHHYLEKTAVAIIFTLTMNTFYIANYLSLIRVIFNRMFTRWIAWFECSTTHYQHDFSI